MRRFRHRPEDDPKQAKRLRAACYARVSTEEQAQHGFSIEAQKEKLDGACRLQDFEVAEVYVDDGYSGKDLNRPAAQKMIADAKAKKFDLILVYKLDRLSRRLGDLIPLGEKLDTLGISIRSITEPFDTSNPPGKLLFNMLGSFAQFERELIGERTRLGIRKRLRTGRWCYLPPYGYAMDKDGRLSPKPDEMRLVQRIYRLCLDHNMGVLNITRAMRAEDKTTRRRGKWFRNSVWNILTNPLYCGYFNVGGELVKAGHETAVSEEEFRRTQEVLKERTTVAPRSLLSPNVLTGQVRCGRCGSNMTTQRTQKTQNGKLIFYYYYACVSNPERCGMAYINAKYLERTVLGEIRRIAAEPGMVQAALDEHRRQGKGLEAELRQERLRAGRVKWLVDNLPDKTVADQVGAEIKAQLRAIEELRGRLTQIDARLAELRADEVRAEEISKYLGGFMATFDKLDTGQRRLLMQALVKEVVVKSKHQCRAEFKLLVPPSKPASSGIEKGPSSEKKGLFARLEPPKPDYSRVPVILFDQSGSGGGTRTPNLPVNSGPLHH